MDSLQALSDKFFDEDFWLAENITWKDLENTPGSGIYIAQTSDLWMIFPCALVLFVARFVFENYVAYPLGIYNNISTKTVAATPRPELESVFRRNQYPSDSEVDRISKQTDLSVKTIQRWFRRRRNQARPTQMVKYTETAWRCFFYICIHIYGLWVLWDKPWLTDLKECWRNHPKQHVTADVYWYYMIELGFYVCLLFSQFADVKRKDFVEHFVHHIVTILLMCFSWCANYVRVGTLILCLHDTCDYWLEGAKLAKYTNKSALCDGLFVIFTVLWLFTRLMLYPYAILWTTAVDAAAVGGFNPALYLFNLLLFTLQILHFFWFYMIMKVAIKALFTGTVDKDVRSASEESDCDTTSVSPSDSQTNADN